MYPFIPAQPGIDDDQASPHEAYVDRLMRGRDMRDMGLESASDRLRMNVADMGEVHEARARADTRFCPVCPVPHRS